MNFRIKHVTDTLLFFMNGNALALYASDNFKFKKRFLLKCDSSITQAQAVRLAKNIPGFYTKVTFVDTKEDVS